MTTITRFAGLVETLGTECVLLNWRALVMRPLEARRKIDLPGWSAARFQGGRRGAHVLDAGAVVCDHDDGIPIEEIMNRWAAYHAIIHSTFTSTSEVPKYRVIVPTTRPFTAAEHPKVWRAAQTIDATIDPNCKDAGRFWFAPAHRPGAPYEWRETGGELLDVDNAIAAGASVLPRRAAFDDSALGVSPSVVCERARRYLARIPGAVSGSGGHQQTWLVALALTKGFSLLPHVALDLLGEWNQRCVPPWSQRELVHKLASAANARDVTDGYLLSRSRDER